MGSLYFLDGGLHTLPNVIIPGVGQMALIDVAAALADSVVTWQDFEWLRKAWPGPIIAKGVLTGDDARRAIDAGAAGVVVSNHGGRQLDGDFRTLPAPASGNRAGSEWASGSSGRRGVRREGDIIKAICMGARRTCGPCLPLYGMAAAGTPGVHRAISILAQISSEQ